MFYNQYRYYQSQLQIDWRLLMTIMIVSVSVLQHFYWISSYKQMLQSVKNTPMYKNKLKSLEYELQQKVATTFHWTVHKACNSL